MKGIYNCFNIVSHLFSYFISFKRYLMFLVWTLTSQFSEIYDSNEKKFQILNTYIKASDSWNFEKNRGYVYPLSICRIFPHCSSMCINLWNYLPIAIKNAWIVELEVSKKAIWYLLILTTEEGFVCSLRYTLVNQSLMV